MLMHLSHLPFGVLAFGERILSSVFFSIILRCTIYTIKYLISPNFKFSTFIFLSINVFLKAEISLDPVITRGSIPCHLYVHKGWLRCQVVMHLLPHLSKTTSYIMCRVKHHFQTQYWNVYLLNMFGKLPKKYFILKLSKIH